MQKRCLLSFIFLILYAIIYFGLDFYKQGRIKDFLEEQKNYLSISYNQGLDRFESLSHNIAFSLQSDTELTSLVASFNKTNAQEVHDKIYAHLEDEFYKLNNLDVMGIQIATPKGVSIVRMHEKNRFGDNLTKVRPMIREVNKTHKHLQGFEEGKTSHAFRQAFPLYYEREYIGVLEILFSSTRLQDYTMRAAKIHTHFIVNKNVFRTNEWESNSQEPYQKSIEHPDYFFSLNSHMKHDVLDESARLLIKPLQKELNAGFKSKEDFSAYRVVGDEAKVLTFLAVQHFVDKKTVAYLIAYTSVPKLYDLIRTVSFLKVILFLLLLVVFIVLKQLLGQKERTLKELKYDELTEVFTRKYFMSLFRDKKTILSELNRPLCVVMGDIDHFKNVNDTYGHQYGDDVLKEFALILKKSMRHEDIIARYGGEEFVIVLRTDIQNAEVIMDGIREKIYKHSFGDDAITVSGSFGIVELKSGEDESIETLIAKADRALYMAKEQGRNQVVCL